MKSIAMQSSVSAMPVTFQNGESVAVNGSPPVMVQRHAIDLTRSRIADYLELTKPRIAVLVLFTVATGALAAGGWGVDIVIFGHALVGTALVAAGASVLNQWLERDRDALMKRTESRPLPAGRVHPAEALAFGVGLGMVGIAYLALNLHHPWAALVATITFVSYVAIYTPLKSKTPLNTLVGAVPGALPPVIGWVAIRGSLEWPAFGLFFIVFLWQIPHFLAIAWLYRDDYQRAGFRMLPAVDKCGRQTGCYMVSYCLVLIPASLMLVVSLSAGPVYWFGAMVLGVGFLRSAYQFALDCSEELARRALRTSLIYLPGILLLLLLDGLSSPIARAIAP